MKYSRLLPAALLFTLLATACELDGAAQRGAIYVPRSIDPTGEVDVSAAFKSFLASVPDGKTIVFQPNARYRMEETLVVRNRRNLDIDGNGSLIFATTRGYRERSAVRTIYSSNITFRDLKVKGANPNAGVGDAAWVVEMEGQMGFEARSVDGFTLKHVTVTDVYGDFVYLSRDEDGPWTSKVRITGSTFSRNGRMGVSTVAARDVVIEGNRFDQMRQAAFDFEAHYKNYGVDGVTIRNNDVGATRLLFVAAVAEMPVNNVVVSGNRVQKPLQVWVSSAGLGTPHFGWKIVGNTSGTLAGAASQTVMAFSDMRDLEIRANYQAMDPRRSMYGATLQNSCGTVAAGNDFPGAVAATRSTGGC